MALRSIWACGSLIVSTIRPRITAKLLKWSFPTYYVDGNSRCTRVLLMQNAKYDKKIHPATLQTLNFNKINTHSAQVLTNSKGSKTCHVGNSKRSYSNYPEDDERDGDRMPLQLMEFKEILWPNVIKSLKNKLFALLITGYYDKTFSIDSFIEGCTQAVSLVSSCISEGNFDSLQGLVEEEAIQEIRNSYADLNISQRRFIHVNPRDVFFRFVYEIGMMFDDETDQRFVEVTVVLQGFHGYHEAKEKEPADYYNEVRDNQDRMYVCNYRFIREFTKGVEGDWSINKLNHFSPRDFMMR